MPAVGRKPKPDAERGGRGQNQHAPVYEWVQVVETPYVGKVPRLPWTALPGTKRWWRTITKMPHCVLWDDADWEFAIATARVYEQFIKSGQMAAARELRQREKLLGTTWDARRDLRIKYVQAEAADETAVPVSLADRRKELEG